MEELQHSEGPVKGIVPVDAIRAFHNAFREDMKVIDAAALAAAGGSGSLDLVLQRRPFFNEALAWHASGEEPDFLRQRVLQIVQPRQSAECRCVFRSNRPPSPAISATPSERSDAWFE